MLTVEGPVKLKSEGSSRGECMNGYSERGQIGDPFVFVSFHLSNYYIEIILFRTIISLFNLIMRYEILCYIFIHIINYNVM